MNYEAEITDLKRRSDVSEHRINDLEVEMKDNREVLKAISSMSQSLDDTRENLNEFKSDVKKDFGEMKSDIKKISNVPADNANKVKIAVWTAVLSATATAIVGAVLALIIK